MLRTIEEILGTNPLGLFDALQPPMTDVFSRKQTAWSYSARVPAVLRLTELPLPPATAEEKPIAPKRDALYWTENSQGFDFSVEDKLDSERFNQVLWNGLKGGDQPYPTEREGRDLSRDRQRLLRQFFSHEEIEAHKAAKNP